jgi:hypothetical protein
VGFNYLAARAVIDGGVEDGFEILNEGAVAPDIEGLCAVADGEDGFVEIEGVLEQELVDGGAGSVGRPAGGDRFLAVALGVDVEAAAGKKDTLGTSEKASDALGGFVERNDHGVGASGSERGDVLRERALVVLGV